jgi:hypothetical protein
MQAYKVSETEYLVPTADYTDGHVADGHALIGPDHPDFAAWTPFVVSMPEDDDEEEGGDWQPPAPPGGAGSASEQRAELRRWERKSLRRLRDRGAARCEFESAALDEETISEINRALAWVVTAEQVRAVFSQAVESLEHLFPPVYHTTGQQWERSQIARKWRERRLAAEREV